MSSSTEPVIFKRKSKGRPSRQQKRDPSPDDANNSSNLDSRDSPSALAIKLKKRQTPQARLSFGANEGDSAEAFQLKKSNLSRQSSKLKLGSPVVALSPSPARSSGPSYDAVYLNELKASTSSLRKPATPDVSNNEMLMDVDLVESFDGSETGVHDQGIPLIHSESSIRSAKEKREHLRKSGRTLNEDDFVSLSLSRTEDIYKGPHPESRLMREDDDLGDGDDEFAEYTSAQERIALGKHGKSIEAEKRKASIRDSLADNEDDDEESREWELEQIRRGALQTPEGRNSSRRSKPKPVYKPTPIPPATPVPTLGPAIGRLAQQLSQLTASHAENASNLSSLAKQREEVDARELEMRELLENAEKKRTYFAQFQEWILGVASFLDEKRQSTYLFSKNAPDIVTKRRTEDDADDLATVFGALSVTREEGEADEFGRDISPLSPADARKERMAYRAARHARHVRVSEAEEGYSTDSSLPPTDNDAYDAAISSLRTRGADILADVKAEEFRDPSKGRWGSWREAYPDLYINAWGGLGVVSVWEFWVRLEMLTWNPIAEKKNLDEFKWFLSLYEFTSGQEEDLVASMIGTAVLPLLVKMIEEGGLVDVLSEKDMKRVGDLIDEIEAGLGEGVNKALAVSRSLLKHFTHTINNTLTQLSPYLALPMAGFNPASIPSRQRYLNRQVKLLRNLLRFHKRCTKIGLELETAQLVKKLVDQSIVRVAESGWTVGGDSVVREVAELLPQELRTPLLNSKVRM
ncbi:nineteen complex-related protein 2-domain-containing protein [Flagelloscypha sp. PMI_526]|nr:nineteen complex-related protein 2-domain-containing protein [Flagelloscypha sp. PMI_526]